MKSQRPINVNPLTYRFPLTAITSILHRISGVALFLAVPVLLWLLGQSLTSPQDFAQVQANLNTLPVKLLIAAILTGLIYHLVAGVRHLLMDAGIGETKSGSRLGAQLILAVSILLSLSVVIALW